MSQTEAARIEHFPPVDPARAALEAPIARVTLLEDRAQVERRAKLSLGKGSHRVAVLDVAPVLQDVSLRARLDGKGARISDVRCRRALRIRREHKPADARALEEKADELARRFDELGDDRARAERQARALVEMMKKGLGELPEDVAWGKADDEQWQQTFSDLSKRLSERRAEALSSWFAQQDLAEEARRVTEQRLAKDRPDQHLVAWIELDLVVEDGAAGELIIEYVVGNALWRPMHSARLKGGKLSFRAQAAVWQATGEDWRDCELSFSTARSSLGTEPPLLRDDRLRGQRKSDEVVVEARTVAVQRASVDKRAALPAQGVELPGVDDGGDVQTLKAQGRCAVPSDGRPCFIPVFSFEGESETTLVAMPELDESVFLRAVQQHAGSAPILAGPVELLRDNGAVGFTKVLFVAPGERFELGFGPDDAVRVTRRLARENEDDPVGKWTVVVTTVSLYLSNLSDEEKVIDVSERIPVSEIEHVRITLLADGTDPAPDVDENGFCKWRVTLAPQGRVRVKLTWRQATAPGVRAVGQPRAHA